MKCIKCDKKINLNDKYCGNCGTKVNYYKKFLKVIDENCREIIIALAAVFLSICITTIVHAISNPSFIAKKYLNTLANNNYTKLFKYIDDKEGMFVNEKLLTEKTYSNDKMENIKVLDTKIYEDSAIVLFKYSINNVFYTGKVYLNKEKNFFLIDNWKVQSGKIAKNIYFKLPINSSATIDGIDISALKKETSYGYDIYYINNMVVGEYRLDVTLIDGSVVSNIINVSSDKTFYLNNINLNNNTREFITTNAKQFINTIYSSLMNGLGYDQLQYNENIKNYYKNLSYNYKNSNIKINLLNIDDISLNKYIYKNGYYIAYYNIEYSYDVSYTKNTEVINYNGINRKTISLIYDQNNMTQLDNVGNLNLEFPKRG